MRLATLYGLVNEDQRKNITGILRLSQDYADVFHKIDERHAFPLAKAFLLWFVGDMANAKGDDFKRLIEMNPSEMRIEIRMFMTQLGDKLLEVLKKKRQLATDINKATRLDQIKDAVWEAQPAAVKPENVLVDLGSGWTWVKLEENEHEEEGGRMQHCAADDRGDLVSLRDKGNKPHVTMSYSKQNNTVYQIKGKQDAIPDKKYWPALEKFFEETKASVRDFQLKKAEPDLYVTLGKHGPHHEDRWQDELVVEIDGGEYHWVTDKEAGHKGYLYLALDEAVEEANEEESSRINHVCYAIPHGNEMLFGSSKDGTWARFDVRVAFVKGFLPLLETREEYFDLSTIGQGKNPFRDFSNDEETGMKIWNALNDGKIRYLDKEILLPPNEEDGPIPIIGQSNSDDQPGMKLLFNDISDLMLWSPSVFVKIGSDKMITKFRNPGALNRHGRDPLQVLKRHNGEGLAWALTHLDADGIASDCTVDGEARSSTPVGDTLKATDDLMRAPAEWTEESVRRPDPRLVDLLEMRRRAKWLL